MNIWSRIASLPLRVKTALGLVIAAIALTLMALLAVAKFSEANIPASDALLQTVARERAEALNALTNRLVTTATNLIANPVMVEAYGSMDPARVGVILEFDNVRRQNPSIRSIRFVSLEGKVVLSTPLGATGVDDSNQPYFAVLSKTPDLQNALYIGNLTFGGAPSFNIVVAPSKEGQRQGYIVFDIDPSGNIEPGSPSIYRSLRSLNATTGTISFFLISADGSLESPFRTPITPNAEIRDAIASLTTQANSVAGIYISPITGQPTRAFSTTIGALKRILVAEVETLDPTGRPNEINQFMLLVGSLWFVTILLLLLAWLLIESSVIRPLMNLRDLASRSTQGRSISDLELPKQQDEVGELMLSFNALTNVTRQDIKNLELRIAQRTRDIEATRDIGQALSSIRDLDVLLNRVIELIRERFENIYHAQVFLIDPTRQYAVLRVSTGDIGKKLLERGHRLAVGSQSVIGKTTADGQSVVALDTSTSAIHRRNELLPETRAELALPLRTRDGIIGALDLQSKSPEAFGESDIRLFQSVADQLSIAIVNARLFEESQQRLAEIEDLNRRLMGEAWYGYTTARRRSAPTSKPKATTSNEGWSALQRRAVESGDLVEEIRPDVVAFALPVGLRGQILGAVEWTVPRSSYNENIRLLARELTTRLAVSADNARLLEQSQRVADRERLVNDITRKLTQQSDVSQVLQIAVRELGQALRVPQTAIRLVSGTPSLEAGAAIATNTETDSNESGH